MTSTPAHVVTNHRNGFSSAEREKPRTARFFRFPILSESHPENSITKNAVASAFPSMRPMNVVRTPKTLNKNTGRSEESISDEASIRKLVSVTTQTFRRILFLVI